MLSKNLITGIILAGTIAISGTATAFAVKNDDKPQISPNTSSPVQINPQQRSARIKSVLDGLVKDGTISQAQEDAVLKAMAAIREKHALKNKGNAPDEQHKNPCKDGKCKPHDHKHGVLKDLVKDGIITQDQADAIRNAIKSAHDSMNKSE